MLTSKQHTINCNNVELVTIILEIYYESSLLSKLTNSHAISFISDSMKTMT